MCVCVCVCVGGGRDPGVQSVEYELAYPSNSA